MKAGLNSEATGSNGFTLVDLLVVVGVITILIVIQLPAWAAGRSQSKIAVCADHIRQLDLACQLYANDNSGSLPYMNPFSAPGSWAWDTPTLITTALLKSGAQTNTFYCPGTGFTDQLNWGNPTPYSLWSFAAADDTHGFRIIGYVLAFSFNKGLSTTNKNSTILPETITDPTTGTIMPPTPASKRVLVADATISAIANLPGYLHPENNYTSIMGGFYKAHTSPHLNGNIPAGGNLGFKDGHVEWRKFQLMVPRTTSGIYFWW